MVIRQPSTSAQLYAWHRAAIAGENPATHDGLPECGWFKTRISKGGPWLPAEISVNRSIDIETGELTEPERFVCRINGALRDPAEIWTYLKPISRKEYLELSYRASMPPEPEKAPAESKPARPFVDTTLEPALP